MKRPYTIDIHKRNRVISMLCDDNGLPCDAHVVADCELDIEAQPIIKALQEERHR